jgi:hypothetical protein
MGAGKDNAHGPESESLFAAPAAGSFSPEKELLSYSR